MGHPGWSTGLGLGRNPQLHNPLQGQMYVHQYHACRLIIDTEIDWKTYMKQVEQFLEGERDYAVIKGPTGPLW